MLRYQPKQKLLISSCFLGNRVRYDGQSQMIYQLDEIKNKFELVAICPEVSGGLSIPRAPAEVIYKPEIGVTQVETVEGRDVTEHFISGANKALRACKIHQIKVALLKERSPSCGSNYVYDGSFSNKVIQGSGITATLLKQSGIDVYSEETLELLFDNYI